MDKHVSIKDIANKVGVSTALVSYALNGLEKVNMPFDEKQKDNDFSEKVFPAFVKN